jgi:hypothetical protein
MNRLRRQATIALIALPACFYPLTVTAQQPGAGRVTVSIAQPATGSTVDHHVVTVRGAAPGKSNEHVWLLARRKDFAPLWWPQREVAVDPQSGRFEGPVTLGGPQDVGWDFDIAAVLADAQAHTQLLDYWKKAMTTGDWRPIDTPSGIQGLAVVKVKKAKH